MRKGFTLIEMIGVLAIIAILVAAIAPRIFEAIDDSKVTSATASFKSMQGAVVKYYADVGALYPLNSATGVPAAVAAATSATANGLPSVLVLQAAPVGTGLWPRFRGPYMDNLNTNNPPLGQTMTVSAVAGVATALAAATATFDFNGDGTNDLTATNQVVFITLTGISERQFLKVDGIMDAGIGTDLATQSLQGKVKFAAGTMYVYIAHK
jgi:prepilin-type N-terminal cleavage/methylation domain-containing protein